MTVRHSSTYSRISSKMERRKYTRSIIQLKSINVIDFWLYLCIDRSYLLPIVHAKLMAVRKGEQQHGRDFAKELNDVDLYQRK